MQLRQLATWLQFILMILTSSLKMYFKNCYFHAVGLKQLLLPFVNMH